jgi:hypothetical protein
MKVLVNQIASQQTKIYNNAEKDAPPHIIGNLYEIGEAMMM